MSMGPGPWEKIPGVEREIQRSETHAASGREGGGCSPLTRLNVAGDIPLKGLR